MPPQEVDSATWFESELQPHESTLRAYLCGIARAADIDDIVQETYRRVIKARRKGAAVRSPRGLLFATARNVSKDLFRKKSVANTFSVAEIDRFDVLDDEPEPSEAAVRQNELELLEGAIQNLPERCRTVLILRKYENLSHREIAERMGISAHTVESQMTKAVKRCIKYFEERGALPPL